MAFHVDDLKIGKRYEFYYVCCGFTGVGIGYTKTGILEKMDDEFIYLHTRENDDVWRLAKNNVHNSIVREVKGGKKK